MNIPEEAIEAAARAMHPEVWDKALFVREYGEMAGRVHMRRAQKEWLGIARAALEAAAPMLMAQAWNEGAKAMMRAVSEEQSVSFIMPNNPYRKERP